MSLYKVAFIMLLAVPVYSFASESMDTTSMDQIESVYSRQVKLEHLVKVLKKMGVDMSECENTKFPATKFEQNIILDTKIRYLEDKLEQARQQQHYNHDVVSR